jgi:putative flippase GtrA
MKTVNIQFIKFSIIGGLNTLVHYCIFIILFRMFKVDMIVASTSGYLVGILNSFLLNRSWTFKVQGSGCSKDFIRFLFVNSAALITNIVVLKLLAEKLLIIPEISQLGAILFSLVVNFTGNKWWTFRRALK